MIDDFDLVGILRDDKVNLVKKEEKENPGFVNGILPLVIANGSLKVLRFLIKKGVVLETLDEDEKTPLMQSCCFTTAKIEVVEELVRGGAIINSKQKDGNTALGFALSWGHDEIAQFLLKNGAVFTKYIVDTYKGTRLVKDHLRVVKFGLFGKFFK